MKTFLEVYDYQEIWYTMPDDLYRRLVVGLIRSRDRGIKTTFGVVLKSVPHHMKQDIKIEYVTGLDFPSLDRGRATDVIFVTE